ncbi:heterokaryon incompatibility protein-domain-containing protein [Daldinia grandis]|nr:heterokaryon incompatibility protein-domain-containing protein [Daldinia grandis]
MATVSEVFTYPPLPTGEDAIRILNLQPGDFFSPLVCFLTPATFKSRPRYVALSYTWGEPYSECVKEESTLSPTSNTDTKKPVNFTVNGCTFKAGRNLRVAIQHLRSATVSLPLWVDAICINQDDDMEKSAQVAMMSSIYKRAIVVVAWIGPKDNGDIAGSMQWKASQVQHLVSAVSTGLKAVDLKVRSSLGPDRKTFRRISESSYWNRLWVVQEVCCPLRLVFMYGSSIWTYETLRKSEAFQEGHSILLQSRKGLTNEVQEMLTLLDMREQRYTHMTRLENLIECCVRKECTKIRDKIYGLLGIANDIRTPSATDQPFDPFKRYAESLHLKEGDLLQLLKTTRSLEVDYGRSLYDIWSDVIGYIYCQVREDHGPLGLKFNNAPIDKIKNGIPPMEIERYITIVKASGIVQEALGQQGYPVFRAIGLLSSRVLRLGPELESLIESPQIEREWQGCYGDYYREPELQYIRKAGENYMARAMDYDDGQLMKIHEIWQPLVIAWPITDSKPRTDDPQYLAEYPKAWEESRGGRERGPDIGVGPRICLGTNRLIALVPSAARPGDVIVRFWGCNAAIIMRPMATDLAETVVKEAPGSGPPYMIIGRVDVAQDIDQRYGVQPYNIHTEQEVSKPEEAHHEGSCRDFESVYVDLDLHSLQMITASISVSRHTGAWTDV